MPGFRLLLRAPVFAVVCVWALCVSSPASAKEVYTMDEAVRRALEANPGVESSRYGVEASESAVKAARSSFGPSVNATYNFTHYDRDREKVNEHKAFTFGIGISQPLFTGFNLLNSYQKSALQKENQELVLENTRLNIVAQVQAQFLDYLKAEENIRSTERTMARAREQLALAQASYDVGLRPRLDVLQAGLEVTRAETTLIQTENTRDLCRARLNTLLNLPVQADTDFAGELKMVPFDQSLEACLEAAFHQRPDLRMAVKSVEIAYKDLGIVQSSFYPQINANFNWNTTGNDWNAKGNSIRKQDYSSWTAGIVLQWNLFSSGKHAFQSQQVKSQIKSLESQMQSSFNDSALEIKSCLLNAQDAKRMIEVGERAVVSATESYDNAKMRYELQLGTNLDMLTAQADVASAELSLISAKANYLSALSKLYVAMGELRYDLGQ